MPYYIAAILDVVRVLLGYGKHLDQTLAGQAAHPRFPSLAGGFGTHDMRRILLHVQRGILRAMMLERYLLARAAQGRDIEPTQPANRAEPTDIEALDIKLPPPVQPRTTPRATPKPAPRPNPDDPLHFHMPTLKELEDQIRRRSISQTIADICLDFGVTPGGCDGHFWNALYEAMTEYVNAFSYEPLAK